MDAYKKILVTGGIKSGKSSYALQIAEEYPGQKVFLATAEALDEDMKSKIALHQLERDNSFTTIEEPIKLADSLIQLAGEPKVILIDCLTLWVSNLLHYIDDVQEIHRQKQLFLDQLRSMSTNIIIVTNEVGLGIVSENQLMRNYVNEIGAINQEVARICDEVVMVVSGLPHKIKEQKSYAKMD